MNYCKSVKCLKSINELEMDERLAEVLGPVEVDKLVLGIRSSDLIYSISRQAFPIKKGIDKEEWWVYLDMINDVKDDLKYEGYIRHDIDNIVMPERHFAEMYAIPCGLVDKRICQPYFFSNEVYETYGFEFDRLKMILDILEEELIPEWFEVIKEDIMSANRYSYKGEEITLAEIRRFLIRNNKRLRQRFNVCWI